MVISLITLISITCSDANHFDKENVDKCVTQFNECYLKNAKTDWALELVPEVRKVRVFYRCATYQGLIKR